MFTAENGWVSPCNPRRTTRNPFSLRWFIHNLILKTSLKIKNSYIVVFWIASRFFMKYSRNNTRWPLWSKTACRSYATLTHISNLYLEDTATGFSTRIHLIYTLPVFINFYVLFVENFNWVFVFTFKYLFCLLSSFLVM